VGLRDDPDTQIKHLGVGKQQLVEIAKALAKDVKLLILDEPTAALNEDDSQHLLDLILSLKGKGITSIIISHKLNEIEQIADSITIIRDGRTIETLDVATGASTRTASSAAWSAARWRAGSPTARRTSARSSSRCATGRCATRRSPSASSPSIRTSTSAGARSSASPASWARAHRARDEPLRPLLRHVRVGTILIDGKEVSIKDVQSAIDHGMAYVSEDRKVLGLNLLDTIKRSIVAAKLKKIARNGVIDPYAENDIADDYRKKLRIKTPASTSASRSSPAATSRRSCWRSGCSPIPNC
jgi:putative multiple sugar transport system ATP-binding protein